MSTPPLARVALDVPVDELFDYRIPPGMQVARGHLVIVPFGRGDRVGVVIDHPASSEVPTERLKAIDRISTRAGPLPEEFLRLTAFCSRYYRHALGATIHAALPTGLRRTTVGHVPRARAYRLTPLGQSMAPGALPSRASAQRCLLVAFREHGVLGATQLEAVGPGARRALPAFVERGWAELTDHSDVMPVQGAGAAPAAGPALTAAQAEAVAAIAGTLGRFEVHLLHGVTGSGKTEVYLHVMARALAMGGQALLLVPEINLTPQLEARVSERFGGNRVVSLHSNLSDGDRLERWTRASRGDAAVVLGTRLAVFTPMPHLMLVVVDEEHDLSYKQQEGLRYHARDLAVTRASQRGVTIVLGSATPSLETWRHAGERRYHLHRLRQRPNAVPPDLRLVDTREGLGADGMSIALVAAIEQTLGRGEQALLFLNRRGFAPTLFCHACGWVAPCPRCSARLTVHLSAGRLRCHHCGHEERMVPACPGCGNQDLLPVGQGTQRLEVTLSARFPGARIARVDRDSTRGKGAFARLRQKVQEREIDLLVGTQMLAKGHDFPRLTLVGVLDADAALFAADFRAEERLFALLLQVAGRAGRGELPGTVLIQTALPGHPLYAALLAQDFEHFAAAQLEQRRALDFPPWTHQAVLRAEAVERAPVFEFLEGAARTARPLAGPVAVYDPVPSPMARLAGRWRGQVLLQSAQRSDLQRLLQHWLPGLQSRRVRWSIDVDPVDV
jgi:primosomal protein N' (replication factor Y)